MASLRTGGDGWLAISPQHGVVAILIISVLIWTYRRKYVASRIQSEPPKLQDQPVIEALPDLDWKLVEPHKFRIFKPVYHITMALQNSTPSQLITMDKQYLDRILLRRSLISRHPETVHRCLPEGRAAVGELYTYLLVDYLPVRYPTMFKLSGAKSFHNLVTGSTYPTVPMEDSLAALRAIGETVEEDMFLLQETPDGHLAVAFICCFPSGFDPSQKFGNLLKDIHTPVPSYEKIGRSMERIFSRLEVGKTVKRQNWSIQTHDELFNCEGNHITAEDADTSVDHDVDIAKTYLRTELQSLTRLPETRAILFSFKTYMYPITEIKEEGLGADLADAIEGLRSGNAPGMWKYKSAIRWSEPVCEYLRS